MVSHTWVFIAVLLVLFAFVAVLSRNKEANAKHVKEKAGEKSNDN